VNTLALDDGDESVVSIVAGPTSTRRRRRDETRTSGGASNGSRRPVTNGGLVMGSWRLGEMTCGARRLVVELRRCELELPMITGGAL
jgi:hypothetical protein